MVAREPSARTPLSEPRATGTDKTSYANRHRLALADVADDRSVAGVTADQGPERVEVPPGPNAAAEPAPACHIVESVGGRALSRHLAPPVPAARIIFDLSALVEGEESARLVEACLRSTELTSVVMVDGPLARRFVGLLLNRIPCINVLYVLNAGLAWQSGDWEALRDLIGFQRHDPDRLTLFTIDDALTSTVTALGGMALPCRLRPVSARRRPRMGRVALLIGRGTGETPSHGHIAAIAAIAAAEMGDRVGAILVPEEMGHLTALMKSFGLGKRLLPYVSVEDALARLAGTPVVYVAPFPDGVVDLEALVVLDQGGLVLVGPGAVPLPDAVASSMSTSYWEQADELGAMLSALVHNYHKQWVMLHDSIREASRPTAAGPASASLLVMSPAA